MKASKGAITQVVGFSRNHRVIGSPIVGFYGKALEISRARKADVRFTVPIEAGKKPYETELRWD